MIFFAFNLSLSLLLPGSGDQLPVLLPERRGAVGHLCQLGPLEAGAGRGAGELLHSVLIPGEQPRSRVISQCDNDPDPTSGDVISVTEEALCSGFINIRKGLRLERSVVKVFD